MLLFAHEFELDELLELWDLLLTDPGTPYPFAFYFAVAMLVEARRRTLRV